MPIRVLPDGEKDFAAHRALLVGFNPAEQEQSDQLDIPFAVIGSPLSHWTAVSEGGQKQEFEGAGIKVVVAPRDATWYELECRP